jgi:hypothetical protein
MNTLYRTNTLQRTKIKLVIFLIVLLALVGLFVVAPVHAAAARSAEQAGCWAQSAYAPNPQAIG